MSIYFIRHGQTDWNLERRWQSTTDVPLNETGVGQAQQIRAYFGDHKLAFAQAYVSPLHRARTTADILLEESELSAIVEPAIMELDVGDFEGRLESDLKREFGEDYDQWRQSCFQHARPGGESMAQVMSRVSPFLAGISPADEQQNILIVAHQAVNMAMKACLAKVEAGLKIKDFAQNNDEIDIWDANNGRRLDRIRIGS